MQGEAERFVHIVAKSGHQFSFESSPPANAIASVWPLGYLINPQMKSDSILEQHIRKANLLN
jgi:hypothetical protein